jgi:hypothetical protein
MAKTKTKSLIAFITANPCVVTFMLHVGPTQVLLYENKTIANFIFPEQFIKVVRVVKIIRIRIHVCM